MLETLAHPEPDRTTTTERKKVPTLQDSIQAQADRLARERASATGARTADEAGRRTSRRDSDDDRAVTREDHENDRLQGEADGDPTVARPKTLAEQIQERAKTLRKNGTPDPHRGRGRTR